VSYTTGEMAKLCGVSVRTVQYYDARGILSPSELSEGGRRLYDEDDLSKLKLICFLREMDFSINDIGKVLAEEHPEKLILYLLDEQEKLLSEDIGEKRTRLERVRDLRRCLKNTENVSCGTIRDMANIMENKKKLRRIRVTMISVGIVLELAVIAGILLWRHYDNWMFFAAAVAIEIAAGIWISAYYFKNVRYICPACHTVFKPNLKEAFFANHTPTTRKLTCPNCGEKNFCPETCESDGK